jgi:hypothetical protein
METRSGNTRFSVRLVLAAVGTLQLFSDLEHLVIVCLFR